MKRTLWIIPFIILAACARAPEGIPLEEVDPTQLTLYHNGVVLTMEDSLPAAQAIAVRGELIERVGSDEEVLALDDGSAVHIDLGGRVLMPGFVDAHTHLLNDHRSMNNSLDEAQNEALKNGITSLGTLYVDESFLREIQAFDEAGFLRVRTSLYLVATDPCGNQQGDWWKKYPPSRPPGGMLWINGVKIFTDGGSCGRVALSFELEPGMGTGDLWYTDDELTGMISQVDAAGYQAAVHAIGDRAVRQALDAFESVLNGQPNILRHRMEHVSVIQPEDVPRFGGLGIIPVLIGEYPNCTPYGPPLPAEYGNTEWPWRDLRQANPGLHLAWHSDVPFQSINPFDHILGFVTRIDLLGSAVCPPRDNPWLVDNTIPVEEALSIMTIQSAYALWRDEEVGSLAPGKYADLVVLENNPLQAQPEELGNNRVLLTVVGGRTEFCWPANPELCPGYANRSPALLPDTRPPVPVRWAALVLVVVFPIAAMVARRHYTTIFRRTGGWAGMLAGLIWIGLLLTSPWVDDEPFLLFILPPFLVALFVAGLATSWTGGRFGAGALWISLLGAISFSSGGIASEWFRSEIGWSLFLPGILGLTTGIFLFGIPFLRQGWMGRLNFVPLIAGLLGGPVPFALSLILPDSSDLPWWLLIGANGVGWLLMGWQLSKK